MIKVQPEVFDAGVLLDQFCHGHGDAKADIGGIVSFTGLARTEAGQVSALELEAYRGFTEGWIEDLMAKAKARFDLLDAMVVHRVGMINPGEAIVFVAAAARHRRQAFEGADFLMDHLKSQAPFWKKQHGPGGEGWIEPRDCDYQDLKRWDQTVPDPR